MSATEERFYQYYMQKVLSTIRKLARSAKKHDEICEELKMLRRTISAIGGAQLPKEKKDALRALIDEALRSGGCRACRRRAATSRYSLLL